MTTTDTTIVHRAYNPPERAGRVPMQRARTQRRPVAESLSRLRDFLFAAASVSTLSDLRVGHIPIFVAFVILIVAANFQSLIAFRYSLRAFVPPLFCFMLIHLTSAFRLSHGNGALFVFQSLVVSIFVWAFITRYSQVSMRRFLFYSGIGFSGILAVVIGYNVIHKRYFSWKLLLQAKSVFDLLPFMLLILRRSNTRSSQILYPVLLPLFIIFVLVSGERKAYIMLALMSPFLINFRNPLVYVAPLVAAALVPIALAVKGGGGYVSYEIGTLLSLGHGKVEHSISNDLRAKAIGLSWQLFKEHPIFGVGTNGYHKVALVLYQDGLGVHNEWMRVLAENGLVGIFFYFLTVLWGFFGLFKSKSWGRTKTVNERILAYGFFVTCTLYLSFEALGFITLTAFFFIPLLQHLRWEPTVPTSQGGLARRSQLA